MERLERKPIRLQGYDYSAAGYYFVTVCAKERRCLFGSVGASCARPALSRLGMLIQEELLRWEEVYPNVLLDKYVIMPNHIHLIVRLEREEAGRAQLAPTVSRVIQQFKGAVTKRAGYSPWQKSFHDHIIRGEADYLRIWQYIDTNPLKWVDDVYYTPDA